MKILATWLCVFSTALAQAQEIEFTVHHAPGGPSDRVTRLISQELPAKNYVVINRPGASGRIAVRHLLSRPAVMIATVPQIFVTNPIMFTDLEYDPGDLELLAVVGVMPNVLVCSPRLMIANIQQLKQHTGRLNFAVAGRGSNEHLATVALLAQWTNHHQIIYYAQGGTASMTDLVGGSIDCMFANLPLARPMLQDGRLRPLLTSHDVGMSVDTWARVFGSPYPIQSELGLVVNRRLDSSTKLQIRKDLQAALASPQMDVRMRDLGLLPILRWDARALAESAQIQQRIRSMIRDKNINLKE